MFEKQRFRKEIKYIVEIAFTRGYELWYTRINLKNLIILPYRKSRTYKAIRIGTRFTGSYLQRYEDMSIRNQCECRIVTGILSTHSKHDSLYFVFIFP